MPLTDARGRNRLTPSRIARAAVRRAALPANYARLAARSRLAGGPVVDPRSDVTVSLTTHGERLATVHLSIESIARGTVLPGQLLLFLDAPMPDRLPAGLVRLQRRGLEVRESPGGLGPHTKYYPFVTGPEAGIRRLVTADDDIVYPRDWLESLVRVGDEHPQDVVCHRAHQITFADGEALPYTRWIWNARPGASHLNFLTGVSGVLYPRELQRRLAARGEAFQDRCPSADDIWLNWVAWREGFRVRQVAARPHEYPTLMSTQTVSLLSQNVDQDLNEPQFRATYDSEDLARLHALAEQEAIEG